MLTALSVAAVVFAIWIFYQHHRVTAALRAQEARRTVRGRAVQARLYRAPADVREDWTKADAYVERVRVEPR